MRAQVVPKPPEEKESAPMSIVPPTSPMAALTERLEKQRRERYFDHPVPGAEEIIVRYAAMQPEEFVAITEFWDKQPKESQSDGSRADVCARSCIGIFEMVDGKLETSGATLIATDDGSPRTFDNLGLNPDGDAIHQVIALYPVKGDFYSLAQRIMKISGVLGEGPPLGE